MLDVVGLVQVKAHPATSWQNVMRFGAFSSHQFVAELLGKRDVHQVLAVNMADLSSPQAILGAAVAMRIGSYTLPTQQLMFDYLRFIVHFFVLSLAWHNLQLAPLAVPQDRQMNGGAGRLAGQQAVNVVHVGDALAV
jgi:hypothetical protein